MQPTKISVSRTIKVNLGNLPSGKPSYENVDLSCSITAELEDSDNVVEVARGLHIRIWAILAKDLRGLGKDDAEIMHYIGRDVA